MAARFYVNQHGLQVGQEFVLPAGPARHVQVLRMQPGEIITLFNGEGGQWQAQILRMGRSDVEVRLLEHVDRDVELALAVTLVAGIPANDRFDWLIEKATELGVHAIQPTLYSRSVLRLSGERAAKKREHWQGVAVAAAEQCGATRVPRIEPMRTLPEVLQAQAPEGTTPSATQQHWILSLQDALPLATRWQQRPDSALYLYSGPEGGMTADEEAAIRHAGGRPTSLGPRVLRAETAPLSVLAWIGGQLDTRHQPG
jgi:16S rRNA (uracil1498-N3)-methyltransferase